MSSQERRALPSDADVVIVGAGMSGLAVAAELSDRSDASILVLEAGPDAGNLHVRQACSEEEALRLWLKPESDPHFWRPYEPQGAYYQSLSGLRRRVGGRSLYWGGALLPIEDWALHDGWPKPIVADLVGTWQGGPSLYSVVAAEMAAWAAAAPLSVPAALTLAEHEFQPTPHAVRAVAGRWAAYSPLEKVSVAGKALSIVPQCHALGVLTEGGRAVGVRVKHRNQELEIATRSVVLAGGTVENSRLVIQVLSQTRRPEGHLLTGLVDKIAQGFTFVCPAAKVDPMVRRAAEYGATFHRSLGARLRSNHFVRLWARPDGAIAFDTWLMGEQQRGGDGAVYCVPKDTWPWPTYLSVALSKTDRSLCAAQQAALTRFWDDICKLFGMHKSALAFGEPFGSADLPHRLLATRGTSVPAGPVTYAFPLGSEQHEAGTTPLGDMLDDTHALRAVRGLYAAGPSSFPRTGAANPAMTILALGQRLGRILANA